MNVSKLTAALLALLVVSTGVGAVAATPGNGNAPDDAGTSAANAPTEEADANATDARDEGMSRDEVEDSTANESDAANDSESMADPANASDGQAPRSEEAAGAAAAADEEERRGPPADLPEQVPDHVGEIHQRIVSFLDGELDSLGAAVSDVTPADDSEDAETDGDAEAAANADGEADAEATSTEEPETEEPTTDEPETEEPETEEDGDSTETATATPTTEA